MILTILEAHAPPFQAVQKHAGRCTVGRLRSDVTGHRRDGSDRAAAETICIDEAAGGLEDAELLRVDAVLGRSYYYDYCYYYY